MRHSILYLCIAGVIALLSGPVFALGTLVTAEGTTIDASRSLIIRSADRVEIATQIKYGAATDSMLWLIAIPNFNRPEDDGVQVNIFSNDALNELDALSRPILQGACDGAPNGMNHEILQSDTFGPGLNMRPATQFYSASQLQAGELNDYITGQGFEISDSLQANIDAVWNENFMMVAVRLNLADLGVARIDPVVKVSYPLQAEEDRSAPQKIALRPLNDMTSDVADIIIWVLDTDGAQMNLTTRPMEFADVVFTSATESNYLDAFDAFVGTRQSQMFITEFAGQVAVADIQNDDLADAMASSGSTYLTRLHARMVPAALRASAAFVTLQAGPGAEYAREHLVPGSECGQSEPDAGMEVIPDAAVMIMDGGVVAADIGTAESTGDSGGDSGGCAVNGASTSPTWVFVLGLMIAPLLLRRRRR